MLVDSFHDTGVFFASFLCGQIIGFVFDIFRGYRKNKKVSKNVLSAQDSLFCAFAFYLFYKTVCLADSGDIRWYTVLGAFFGIVLYFLAESAYIMKITTGLWKVIFVFCKFVTDFFAKILSFPKKLFLSLKEKLSKGFKGLARGFRQFFIKKPTKTLKKDM